jgi:hypothetical protein
VLSTTCKPLIAPAAVELGTGRDDEEPIPLMPALSVPEDVSARDDVDVGADGEPENDEGPSPAPEQLARPTAITNPPANPRMVRLKDCFTNLCRSLSHYPCITHRTYFLT